MCLASNLVKEAAAHADSAAAADKALREIDHEKTTFTRREIESQRHDLVIIEDRVYDADRFQWAHPGGSLFVAMFGGRDGTLAFQSYHMRNFPHEKLRPYLRGRLAPGETITRFDQDHLELSKKIRRRGALLRAAAPAVQGRVHLGFSFCVGGLRFDC